MDRAERHAGKDRTTGIATHCEFWQISRYFMDNAQAYLEDQATE